MRNSVSDLTSERDVARIAYLEKKYRAAAKRQKQVGDGGGGGDGTFSPFQVGAQVELVWVRLHDRDHLCLTTSQC